MDQLNEICVKTDDGKYTISTVGDEWLMSQWVYAPEIKDNWLKVWFSLKGSRCDLRSYKYQNDFWELNIFIHPDGLRGIDVKLDFKNHNGQINDIKYNSIQEIEYYLSHLPAAQ